MSEVEERQQVKAEIGNELYESARRLGVKSPLLFLLGSYGQTEPDERIRDDLRARNHLRREGRRPRVARGRIEREIAEEVCIAFEPLGAPPLLMHILRLWRDGAKMANVSQDLRKLNGLDSDVADPAWRLRRRNGG
jgi:hypothetical protein